MSTSPDLLVTINVLRDWKRRRFDESANMPQPACRMNKLSSILVVALLGSATPTPANAAPRVMSLTDCVQEALLHNLQVQIDRIDPELKQLNLKGAYGGYDPVFNVSGEHDFRLTGGGFNTTIATNTPPSKVESDGFSSGVSGTLPWGLGYNLTGNLSENYGSQIGNKFDTTSGSVGVQLTQPLLKNFLVDNTRLRISISKNRVNYSELGLRKSVMDTVNQVEKAYYDLIAAREKVKVQEKALELAQQLLSENKKKVEVGTLAPLDEKQAESQVAARKADLLTAQQALSAALNALRAEISDDFRQMREVEIEPSEPLTVTSQEFNVQSSWSHGLAGRPEYLQARLDNEQQQLQLKYDRNQVLPDLSLVGGYGHAASGTSVKEFSDGFDDFKRGTHPFYSYGAKLSIPLGNRAARNNYKASKLLLEQLKLRFKQVEEGILAEIDNNVTRARVSLERVTSTHEASLYALAALDAEQKKLENGKSTSFFVLQLQRDLTQARSDEIQAQADYNKALSDLARSEGTTLERRKVDVQVK